MSGRENGPGSRSQRHQSAGDEFPPLTRTQIRELDRRLKDSMDPTRYLLVSAFTKRHALYYNLSDDVYAMNDPARGTLFKRRQAAVAVQALLHGRVEVVRCRVTARGRLILKSVGRVRPMWPRLRKRGTNQRSKRSRGR